MDFEIVGFAIALIPVILVYRNLENILLRFEQIGIFPYGVAIGFILISLMAWFLFLFIPENSLWERINYVIFLSTLMTGAGILKREIQKDMYKRFKENRSDDK